MILKSDEEIELMRKSGELVSRVHEYVASILKPGMTGLELDKKAEEFIRDHKAIPSFKGYNGFPSSLCISPNKTVVHGIPDSREYTDNEIISVDCGVFLNGFHGDCAYTYAFPNITKDVHDLLKVTRTSLYKGISILKAGVKTGDIGNEIQNYCESFGYTVVRELVGHGVGKNLHEAPDVPNYGKKGKGVSLKKNAVIAIEPMINLGAKNIVQENDGWTINTKDGKASAHYEHTVKVGLDNAEILTSHDYLEAEIDKNKELLKI